MMRLNSNFRNGWLWLQRLNPRERQVLVWTVCCLLFYLVWAIAVKPAVVTLRVAPGTLAEQREVLRRMQVLRQEVTQLRAVPAISPMETERVLRTTTGQYLGERASTSFYKQGASISLREVSPGALAQWLNASRLNAHLLPREVHLEAQGGAWSGRIEFAFAQD